MRKVPANCSSTPTIQDHLTTISALITDISAKSKKDELAQMFVIKLAKIASLGYIGPEILLHMNNVLDMTLFVIIIKLNCVVN